VGCGFGKLRNCKPAVSVPVLGASYQRLGRIALGSRALRMLGINYEILRAAEPQGLITCMAHMDFWMQDLRIFALSALSIGSLRRHGTTGLDQGRVEPVDNC